MGDTGECGTGTRYTTELEQLKVDRFNRQEGGMTGYDCLICKNRGVIAYLNSYGLFALADCSCRTIRISLQHISESGLGELLTRCTFGTYQMLEPWQAEAKAKAKAYIGDYTGKWFVACGGVGAGKTHLCTAICGELLNAGKQVRYMRWRDDGIRLKANVNDDETYQSLVEPFKYAEVLYIDDFWKTEKDKAPTQGDINLAFELLNYRYNNRELATVISCERPVMSLMDVDEAVGSRIYERSKQSCVTVSGGKNWRLK